LLKKSRDLTRLRTPLKLFSFQSSGSFKIEKVDESLNAKKKQIDEEEKKNPISIIFFSVLQPAFFKRVD
jgi:hypothetical protein